MRKQKKASRSRRSRSDENEIPKEEEKVEGREIPKEIATEPVPVTSRALLANLREPLMIKDFQNPMTLKEFLLVLHDRFAVKGMAFPILIDAKAFKDENSDSDNEFIFGSALIFPELPKVITTANVLKVALSQIQGFNAEMLIRDGVVHITTQKHASLAYLLEEKLCVSFDNRPLIEIVQNISDLTGVSITLDPRVENKTLTKAISVTFRNDVTLGGALRIIADMAGLKMVDMQSGLYITTPANAKELEKELSK